MAYISESNTINGWFKRYALVEIAVDIWSYSVNEGELCLAQDNDGNDYILAYISANSVYRTCIDSLYNETTPFSDFNPKSRITFNIRKYSGNKAVVKLIVPIIASDAELKELEETVLFGESRREQPIYNFLTLGLDGKLYECSIIELKEECRKCCFRFDVSNSAKIIAEYETIN